MDVVRCEGCPCPEVCLARPIFCQWVAEGKSGKHAHICNVSRILAAEPETEFPPLTHQLGNALAAAGRAVQSAACGQPLFVDQAEQDRRLEICQKCDHYEPCAIRCKLCGCNLNLKTRLQSETGQCPAGKW
jgi:hypothetical protein